MKRILPILALLAIPAASQTPPLHRPAASRSLAVSDLSEAFEQLARTTTRSVVQLNVSGFGVSPDAESPAGAALTRERGVGSGVVVSPDGYIVTNAHVVHGGQKITVTFRSRDPLADQEEGPNTWPARVIGVDTETDLAVVKVERDHLAYLAFANSDRVRQGQVVVAFGSPLGLSNSMTMGVVSSPARQLAERDFMQYIQTDTPINPGNSGGPLVDANGNLVGINTMILTQSGGSEGIGLSIPSNLVQSVYQQLRANGRIRRGMIGVNAQQVTPTLADGLSLKKRNGVIITDVGPGGPADKGGLKIGDVILTIDGQVTLTPRDLELRVFRARAGEVLHLTVWRQDNETGVPIDVKVSERPDSADKLAVLTNPKDHLISQFGVLGLTIEKANLELLGELRESWGIAVTALAPQPTAWTEQLKPGDVIHRFNGEMVTSLESLRERLGSVAAGDAVVLQVERSGSMRYVAFRAD